MYFKEIYKVATSWYIVLLWLGTFLTRISSR